MNIAVAATAASAMNRLALVLKRASALRPIAKVAAAVTAQRVSRPIPRPPMAAAAARRLVVCPASSSSQRPACSSPRSARVAASSPHTAMTSPTTPTAW